ncbi:MAG: RDD family protein [Chloroflexota bacterium]
MTLDESLQIDTPENVAFGYRVAGIGSRFMAALVDTILILLLQALVVSLLIIVVVNAGFGESDALSSWILAILGIVSFLFFWGYYIFFEMLWNGQSPGKRMMSLRVIRADGTPITLMESLIRNLVRIVDLLPTAYGVGVVTMFINPQSRRLGDLAAGTLVVHEHAASSAQLAASPSAALRVASLKPSVPVDFPVERLTHQEVALIEEFLQRRDDMSHRAQLASQILARLHERVGHPEPGAGSLDPETRLAAIYAATRNKNTGA